MDITLSHALDLINAGRVIAMPTETVYGLAASLFKDDAINQIFVLKGRPANNPLIIHVADQQDILPFIDSPDEDFFRLAEEFWPGPLTLVLPIIEEKVPARVRANLKTAAFRVPSHPLTRELLTLAGPLVMPSANLSGNPSATSRLHVEADFGQDFPVLDGGPCDMGVESTILYKDPTKQHQKIIRQGALTQDDFSKVLGYRPEIVAKLANQQAPICPGQLYRHYAPQAKLTLATHFPNSFKGVIVGYDDRHYPSGSILYSLGNLNHPKNISKNLYRILRKLDEDQVKEALVDTNIPNTGIFATVLERLQKASSK